MLAWYGADWRFYSVGASLILKDRVTRMEIYLGPWSLVLSFRRRVEVGE